GEGMLDGDAGNAGRQAADVEGAVGLTGCDRDAPELPRGERAEGNVLERGEARARERFAVDGVNEPSTHVRASGEKDRAKIDRRIGRLGGQFRVEKTGGVE